MPRSLAPHLPPPPSPSRNTAKLAESVLILQHQGTCSPSAPGRGNTTQGTANGFGFLTSDKQRLLALLLELKYLL